MRNVVRLILALSGALMLLLAGCSTPTESMMEETAGPVPVTVVTLKTRPLALTRELPGRTNPLRIAEVRPQVSGIIEERLFEEGDRVADGQVLYRLEDATYQADVNSARAARDRAKAAVEQTRLQARRARELFAVNAISEQDHDTAIANLEVAEGDLGVARAALERAETLLSYTRITAPIAGVIGRSMVTEGALVTANQDAALAVIQQLDPMYVDVTQSSAEWLQLRRALASGRASGEAKDAATTILLEDGTAYPHEGRLTFADVAVDPSTGRFALRAIVPNPDRLLMPGMYVRAVLSNVRVEHALLVPQEGIARDPKGNATAMVVNAQGLAELREVQVSRTVGSQWLVAAGLEPGDRVIVAGLQKIQPGSPVEPSEAEDAAPVRQNS